jgi:hypothetical protein
VKWPDRILVYGCESCGGIGTHPRIIHHDCEAVRDWHQWFADNPDALTRPENPVKVPLKVLAYVPGDEPESDLCKP